MVAVTWVRPNMPMMMPSRPNGTIRPTGILSTSRPAIGMVTMAPRPWGATRSPALSVDSPRICWKYVGTSSSPPKNAAANMNIMTTETARLRFWNSLRSSSGCSGRKECHTKASISSTPTSIDTHTRGAVKSPPSAGSEETPNRNSARPGDISAMPTKSKDSEGSGLSLSSTNQA